MRNRTDAGLYLRDSDSEWIVQPDFKAGIYKHGPLSLMPKPTPRATESQGRRGTLVLAHPSGTVTAQVRWLICRIPVV